LIKAFAAGVFCIGNGTKSFSGRGEMVCCADKVKVATTHNYDIEFSGISHL
jgi:hypothetical protein